MALTHRPPGPAREPDGDATARPARRGPVGALRGRQDGRHEALRGPRLRRVDNLPGELLPDARRSDRARAGRASSGSRSSSTCGPATRRSPSPRCAARSRAAASGRRSSSWRRATRSSSGATRRPATATRSRAATGSRARSPRSAGSWTPVRAEADVILDTSELSLRELKERIFAQLWARRGARPAVASSSSASATSSGCPLEADLVFDVRFLQNPYYVPELRPLSGLTDRCPDVRARPAARARASSTRSSDLLDRTIPAYVGEGKTRLTIAIGCTGGYHRSIVLAEELATLAARRRPAGRSRLPPRAGAPVTREPPALAAARDRHQALARRRLPRPRRARPRRRAGAPPGLPRGRRRRARSRRSSPS